MLETENGKCYFSLKVNNVDYEYSQELIAMMKEQDASDSEIERNLEITKKDSVNLHGKEGECLGEKSAVEGLLKKWDKGSFASSDWDSLECVGEFFDNVGSFEGGSKQTLDDRENMAGDSELAGEGEECYRTSDCKQGYHCNNDVCVSNSIMDAFEDCSSDEEACVSKDCENCYDGKYSCPYSSDPHLNNKCVECFTDFGCKEGYVCDKYRCVEES